VGDCDHRAYARNIDLSEVLAAYRGVTFTERGVAEMLSKLRQPVAHRIRHNQAMGLGPR
jgi:hypothetical protein